MSHAHWIALARASTLSRKEKIGLAERLGGFSQVFEIIESSSFLLGDPALDLLRSSWDLTAAQRELAALAKLKAWLVTLEDKQYPELLKSIYDPPLVLYGLGRLPKDQDLWLSVVGTRKPSEYGKRVAKALCQDLANYGVPMVSGLARGIDSLAHWACVHAGVPTIAVLAHGLDQVYPPENRSLAQRIIEVGALLTEFTLHSSPLKQHFPQRNRIVAGLSPRLLVIEGAERSGAKITAGFSLEQGRDVFAVPGQIDTPTAALPNSLIAQGAKPILSSADVLVELPMEKLRQPKKELAAAAELNEEEKIIRAAFNRDQPTEVDEVFQKTQIAVPRILSVLSQLELRSLVERTMDGRFVWREL